MWGEFSKWGTGTRKNSPVTPLGAVYQTAFTFTLDRNLVVNHMRLFSLMEKHLSHSDIGFLGVRSMLQYYITTVQVTALCQVAIHSAGRRQ